MVKKSLVGKIDPSHRKLRPLVDGKKPDDLLKTFKNMAKSLGGCDTTGVMLFRIREKEAETVLMLEKQKGAWKVHEKKQLIRNKRVIKPKLEIGMSRKIWMKIAAGSLSPWKALNRREIFLRGDIDQAGKMVAFLAISD